MSKIKPQVAQRRIESFEKRFGETHLYLAYHAAFPLALTPDLLYRLWANFQRDIHGEVLNIPWISVADLLLSNLCDEVGHELYEMDLAVRNQLLRQLKEDEKFGQQRIQELSDFMLYYIRQQLHSNDPDVKDFAEAQKWTALAYTQPSEAARELALVFSKLHEKDIPELVRMASLTETMAESLADFQPLLIYARGMGNFARGNLETATNQLAKVLEGKKQVEVAGISLPIPEQINLLNLPHQSEQLLTNPKNWLKKSRTQSLMFLSAAMLLFTLGGGTWLLTGSLGVKFDNLSTYIKVNPIDQSLQDRISFGEKTLIAGEVVPAKKEGVEAIAAENYEKAIAPLTAALKQKPNDPEALIFLNNARIGSAKSYSIVTSLPIGSDLNTSLEILRGIAQAQNEINVSGGIKGVRLKVGIANDDDNPEISKQIATTLVKNQEVLGVVGPTTSDATLAAGTVYTSGKLVAITPTSTSVKISNFSPYVFRTVPSDFIAARSLANYMVNKLQKKNAAVFFNSQSNYSQSLKSEFVSSVSLEGGQVLNEFDLSQANFSAVRSVEQAIKQGAEVLMLASNTETLDKALQVVNVNDKRLALLGGDDFYTFKTLELGRQQAVGLIVAIPGVNYTSDFTIKSRQLWSAEVGWRTALCYDATQALIAAIELNPTREGVQQALTSSNFSATGASGTIRFLASGDRNAPVQLVKIAPGTRSRTGYDFVPIPQSAIKSP